MKNKFLNFFVAMFVLSVICCVNRSSADATTYMDDTVEFVLSDNILTVRGTGKIRSLPISFYESNIETVVIEEGIQEIQDGVFSGCSSLKNISISGSVVSIGENTFKGCTNLKQIVVKSVKLKSVGKNALSGMNNKAKIKVPKKKVKKYKKLFEKKGNKLVKVVK